MIRIAFFAKNFGTIPFTLPLPARNIFLASGHNLGNLAFWDAMRSFFSNEMILFDIHSRPDSYVGKVDLIVIPAANWLNFRQDFGPLARFIEEVNVPCIVLGLGAQSKDETIIPELTEGTVRFLKAAASRTPFLGVRGTFTERVCAHHGITSVKALGCPSILREPSLNLGKVLKSRWKKPPQRVAVHALSFKPQTKTAERVLFASVRRTTGAFYIIQSPIWFVKLATGEKLSEKEEARLISARKFLTGKLPDEEFTQLFRTKSYLPLSIDCWRNFLFPFTHAIGTRIHGAIVSMMTGIPSICVTHDTRTRELCETLRIPSIEGAGFAVSESIGEIFQSVTFNAEDFDANRIMLARSTAQLLCDVGVKPSQHLKHLCGKK